MIYVKLKSIVLLKNMMMIMMEKYLSDEYLKMTGIFIKKQR